MIAEQDKAIAAYHGMRDTLSAIPRMTTALNHARRHAVDSVNRLIEEFEKSLRLTREFYDFLKSREK
jgi:hypothetical protein